jgi:uncharacterized protein (TIGR03066 family)
MRRTLYAAVLPLALFAVTALAAPVPKEKAKTVAEKLVGKWQCVRVGRHVMPSDFISVTEYKKDGTWNCQSHGPGRHIEEFGTYKLNGMEYELTVPTRHPKYRTITVQILEITDRTLKARDKHDLQGELNTTGDISECKRRDE